METLVVHLTGRSGARVGGRLINAVDVQLALLSDQVRLIRPRYRLTVCV